MPIEFPEETTEVSDEKDDADDNVSCVSCEIPVVINNPALTCKMCLCKCTALSPLLSSSGRPVPWSAYKKASDGTAKFPKGRLCMICRNTYAKLGWAHRYGSFKYYVIAMRSREGKERHPKFLRSRKQWIEDHNVNPNRSRVTSHWDSVQDAELYESQVVVQSCFDTTKKACCGGEGSAGGAEGSGGEGGGDAGKSDTDDSTVKRGSSGGNSDSDSELSPMNDDADAEDDELVNAAGLLENCHLDKKNGESPPAVADMAEEKQIVVTHPAIADSAKDDGPTADSVEEDMSAAVAEDLKDDGPTAAPPSPPSADFCISEDSSHETGEWRRADKGRSGNKDRPLRSRSGRRNRSRSGRVSAKKQVRSQQPAAGKFRQSSRPLSSALQVAAGSAPGTKASSGNPQEHLAVHSDGRGRKCVIGVASDVGRALQLLQQIVQIVKKR